MLIYVRENLIMRSFQKNDASMVYETIDKNRNFIRTWLRWVDDTNSPTVIEDIIAKWEKDYENKSDFVFGIFEHGKHIGTIGLHAVERITHSAMVGYWLSESHLGQGIMTDCVRALVNFGFHTLNLNRIYIRCADKNKKSRAIPERLGFVQEAILQDGECLYGKFQDLIIYGMVKRNWNNSSPLN